MVLLTAFEPFGGARVNVSLEVARRLAAKDARLLLHVLPVARGAAEESALSLLHALGAAGACPHLMVSLGEAGGRDYVALEKVAINWDDFRIKDNNGSRPRDTAIDPAGPDALFATLPVARIAARLENKTPLPVRVSLSAGAFVCNHLAYRVLHARPACPYAFIHVPAVRNDPAALAAITETVRIVLRSVQTEEACPAS